MLESSAQLQKPAGAQADTRLLHPQAPTMNCLCLALQQAMSNQEQALHGHLVQ
eukprot:CAMPEP_0172732128 /NCGR_PEP_ID=MMETSP1074-20121228/103639_1 /TAXON_ID=2916 /ORGANISM="Ceratium fusus, Strain PA161109" /LENGTH=52 /DNA_ID=CAMNT_0013560355 /DNA_START=41 /DNA_END=196 /DNA_ORIENTATION=+